jgi:hypothetical protein
MQARLAPVLVLLASASLAGAGTLRVTDSFDDGPASNEAGWTGGFIFDGFGFGLREEIVPDGGTRGGTPYLFRFAEEFQPEFHTTPGADTAFHGDWRESDVRSFSASLKIFQYEDFLPEDHDLVVNGQPMFTRERHVSLMITRDLDASVTGDECTIVSVGGHHVTSGAPEGGQSYFHVPPHVNQSPRGEGWETFHFPIHASSETLPAQWAVPGIDTDVNRDGDPDFFDNFCPSDPDEAWRYVTEDVGFVTLRLADPIGEAFGIGQFFGYGLDEPTLVLGR